MSGHPSYPHQHPHQQRGFEFFYAPISRKLASTSLVQGLAVSESTELVITEHLYIREKAVLSLTNDFKILMRGASLHNQSQSPLDLTNLADAELRLTGEQWMMFEAAGEDVGSHVAGLEANFAFGRLVLGEDGTPGWLRLVDESRNTSTDSAPETVYVKDLVIAPESRIDLNGLTLYYLTGSIAPSAQVLYGDGGDLVAIPEPVTSLLVAFGLIPALRRRRSSES